jgi:hypothetical protein
MTERTIEFVTSTPRVTCCSSLSVSRYFRPRVSSRRRKVMTTSSDSDVEAEEWVEVVSTGTSRQSEEEDEGDL